MLFNYAKISYTSNITAANIDFSSYKIFYRFDKDKVAIAYYAVSDNSTISIAIRKKEIPVNPFNYMERLNSIKPDELALLRYIYEKEKGATEDKLRSFYGPNYDTLAFLSSLTKADLERYEKEKQIINSLRDQLSSVNDLNMKKAIPSLDIKLSSEYDYYYISTSLIINGDVISSNIRNILDGISQGRIEGKKSNVYQLALEDFSFSDQQILFILMKMKFISSRSTQFTIGFNDFVSILKAKANEYITYDKVKYKVLAPFEVSVEIKEDGRIISNLHEKNWILTESICYRFDTVSKVIQTATLKSGKLFYLLKFSIENPRFNVNDHLDSFANNILPQITSITKINPIYIEKTNKFRTTIQLYLDIEEDGLIVKSKYLINGNEETSDTYSSFDSSTYLGFVSELEKLSLEDNCVIEDGEMIVKIMSSDLTELKRYCDVFLSETLSKMNFSTHSKINILTHSGIDWFDVQLASNQYSMEELQTILASYKRKKKYVRLKDKIIKLDDENIIETIDNFEIDEDSLTSVRLPLYQAIKLKSLENDAHFNATAEITNLFKAITNFSKTQLDISEHYLESMRPYQIDGVKWLYTLNQYGLGGILADDMGLGKSLQLIAFLSLHTLDTPGLIVCPKSLIFNWQNEFIKWNGKQQTIIISGTTANRKQLLEKYKNKKDIIFVTSYDSLRNDISLYEPIDFSYCFLDEAQYIANALAKKTLAVKSIKANHKFVLTGTPIQNSLVDLWSIFDFLLPGYLDGYKDFKNQYHHLDMDDTYLKTRLEKLVSPFILRRSKSEVLKELPEKTEEIITISLSDKQQSLYDAMYQEALLFLRRNNNTEKIKMLAYLTRLRQICVDPTTFIDNFTDMPDKLEYVINLIKNNANSDHKFLIFSSFATVLNHILILLKKEGINVGMIYGKTPAEDRIKLADEFNDLSNDLKVMLVSLKAGGTGLNLVGADIIIHLDPWWNLAAENQATDRAHRIGQKRAITIFKLVCKGSIEEKVIELQKKKKALGEIIHEYDETSTFSDEDIEFLLS